VTRFCMRGGLHEGRVVSEQIDIAGVTRPQAWPAGRSATAHALCAARPECQGFEDTLARWNVRDRSADLALEALAQSPGAAVVVAHHFAKEESSGKSAVDRMSGTGLGT
jgi:hypothetical protein